jgi:carbamate kinase
MRVVVALGGNALLPRGEELSMARQRAAVRAASRPLARVAEQHQLVITHGNGPQVGLLGLQAEAYDPRHDVGLDVLDAESAGMIGYLLQLELGNQLEGRSVATLLTTTLVDAADPAFAEPTKFVGPAYDRRRAERIAAAHPSWTLRADGPWVRRVVPSPRPLAVEPMAPAAVLLDLGFVVVCGGGGGMPVVVGEHGHEGVEAVVDKDAVSALVATDLAADLLVIATDVDGVYEGFGTPAARRLSRLDLDDPEDVDLATLPAGSMRPKVQAAGSFVRRGGRAVIGALDDLPALVAGTAGTTVTRTAAPAARP